jgi:GNAT superfamily N-acetyltransferase
MATEVRVDSTTTLPAGFEALLVESRVEGLRLLARLEEESRLTPPPYLAADGCLLAARIDTELMGVCALYRDPFLDDPEVARLRHLYVAARARRAGIGRRLVEEAILRAGGRFRRIRLRTDSKAAAALYAALGFSRTTEPNATHTLSLR